MITIRNSWNIHDHRLLVDKIDFDNYFRTTTRSII